MVDKEFQARADRAKRLQAGLVEARAAGNTALAKSIARRMAALLDSPPTAQAKDGGDDGMARG